MSPANSPRTDGKRSAIILALRGIATLDCVSKPPVIMKDYECQKIDQLTLE